AVGGVPPRGSLVGRGVLPVDRPLLPVDRRVLAVGRPLVPVGNGPLPATPGRPHDQPEHHTEHAYEYQDVTERVDSDAMRRRGGDPEPQDGSHRDEQKACTYPHGLTSLSEFWSARPTSPGSQPQTDAATVPAVTGVTRAEDCARSATVCAAQPSALGRYLIGDRRGIRGHGG